jgi:integrase
MRVNLPGLLQEKTAAGNTRYRVRVQGDKRRRITLKLTPGHPDFMEHYSAAREGRIFDVVEPINNAIPQSIAWLSFAFEKAMQERVHAGLMHTNTLKQRAAFYARLRAAYGDKAMSMPTAALIEFRDTMTATPGAADNMVKAVRAMFAWGIERGHVKSNPAKGIGKINRGTGAVAWSIDDLNQFRECHGPETMAHLALTLFMFTAARIGDVYRMGRNNELNRDGITWLDWIPEKAGSARVTLPIMPPLAEAIRAQKVIGQTYLLNGWGKSFASKAAFGNWFRDRVSEAGLTNRSPHGIRKAAGELMALEGATQYHIMAIHGHTQARTSEVYTSGVNRVALAKEAMANFANLDW